MATQGKLERNNMMAFKKKDSEAQFSPQNNPSFF